MELALREKIQQLRSVYVKIPDESLEKIYQLFCQHQVGQPVTGLEYLYFGAYYHNINHDYDVAEQFYQTAVKLGHLDALVNLGTLFYEKQDWPQVKKYYLASIEENNEHAMGSLGIYYRDIEKNKKLAKQYHRMAAEANNSVGMFNLAEHYSQQNKSKLSLVYMKKAAQLGYDLAISRLCSHYLLKPIKLKYLFFGLTYGQHTLIRRNYSPGLVHYLLRGKNSSLIPRLKEEKQTYLTDLFHSFQQTETWFKYSCVKDIREMIQTYLNQ